MSQATLDNLIDRARHYKMTPADRRAQRVSLVMGLRSDRSTLTREKVEDVLDQVEGHEAGAPGG
jgi:hypothetical protein